MLWQGAFRPRPRRNAAADRYPLLPGSDRRAQPSYEALAHITLPTLQLHEISPPGTNRDAQAGQAFLDKVAALKKAADDRLPFDHRALSSTPETAHPELIRQG